MKTKPLRCKHCKKDTLVDISIGPQQINPFTIRSVVGKQCSACGNYIEKTYTFVDAKTGEKTIV